VARVASLNSGRLARDDQQHPPEECDPEQLLDSIALRYGRVVEILEQMGFRGQASHSTFNEYIKSLRKLGIPVFGQKATRRGRVIMYSFENTMDLVLALLLRVYGTVPDPVLKGFLAARRTLHPIYRRAYAERRSGLGKPIRLALGSGTIEVAGVFLDLRLVYAGGRLLSFGPPEAISPGQALARYAASEVATAVFMPIRLSPLCEEVAHLALAEDAVPESTYDDRPMDAGRSGTARCSPR